MNAVGIDVSKGKSMVAALRPMGEVALLPQEFLHTEVGLEQMAYAIIALGEDTRVVMEATGRCHEPVAAALHEYGIYVCLLNPLFIKQSGGGSIRKVKTDKADAMKIAKTRGAATIALTNIGKSPIMKTADITLETSSDETQHSILALNSRIAQLAIIDALYDYIVIKKGDEAKQAIQDTEKALMLKKY